MSGGDIPEGTYGSEKTTVFFSYSRLDQKRAVPIIRAIEAAGYAVWWDGMLEAGSKYLERTEEALVGARAVVVLWSKTSVSSNWVRDEAMSGREVSRLVPLSLDGVEPPLGYRQFQVTDFSNWRGRTDGPEMIAVLRGLAKLHDRPMPTFVAAPAANGSFSRRTLLLGGAVMVAAGGLGVSAIRRFGGASRLAGNGVVVFPFTNLSGDAALDYVSAGVSVELRSALMRNATLRVVAQRSSEALQAGAVDAVSIARELGVSFIIDGSLHRGGDQMRISTELIDGKTGFSQWSKTFVAPENNLLLVQSEIVNGLTRSMSDAFQPDGDADIGMPTNPAAYDAYLRGLDKWRSAADPDDGRAALALFDEAVGLDENFAIAHAFRGLILSWLSSASADKSISTVLLREALAAGRRAIELGPDLADGHSTLGWVEFFSAVNVEGAAAPFEQSRELGRGNASVLARYATYACLVGKGAAAESAVQRALDLDPLNPHMHSTAAIVHYYSGAYADALESARATLRLDNDFGIVRFWAGMAEIQLGRGVDALSTCNGEPNLDAQYTCAAIAHLREGQVELAMGRMEALEAEYGEAASYQRAQILAQKGDLDLAMAALKRAEELKDAGLIAAYADPMLSPLKAREDFSTLLKRLGFDSIK